MAKFIQPRIVSEFKCDGSKCNSKCCKNWLIDIDDETYQKYLELNIPNIVWNNELNKNIFQLLPNGSCPNLDEDGLCKIQKSHGESFLSVTCRHYPRYVHSIDGKFYTRSLTLTCPVAANLILKQDQPIEFIETEDQSPAFSFMICEGLKDQEIDNVIELRLVSIKILQNRRMTIDQRLLTLGFFFSQVGDIRWGGGDSADILRDNIKTLSDLCASEKFINEDLPRFCRAIKFDATDFVRIMLSLLESMYGEDSTFKIRREFFELIESTKVLFSNSDSVSISDAAKKYLKLESTREKLFKHASNILENYLVNEWWLQLFPYRFDNVSTIQNYFFFAIMYKLQEFILTTYLELQHRKKKTLNKSRVEDAVILSAAMFSMIYEHSTKLLDKISGISKTKNDDLLAMMSSMLRV